MARRTKDEAETTRAAILKAAEKVFYKHGVARSSLEQIAAAASVTRGAVYWHFKDKIELFNAMMDGFFLPEEDVMKQLAKNPGDSPLEDLRAACRGTLNRIVSDTRFQRVISIAVNRCEYVAETAALMKRRRACKDRMLNSMLKLMIRARQLNMLAPHYSPELAAFSLKALMNGLITGAAEGHRHSRLDIEGVACLDLFFESLRK